MYKKTILIIIICILSLAALFLFNNKQKHVLLNKNTLSTNNNNSIKFEEINENWLIVPDGQISNLQKNSLRKDNILDEVKKAFGEKNIKPVDFPIGEGDVLSGFAIYPDTENEVLFHISDDKILFKFYGKPNSKWIMDNGIKIGTTLEEVEKINKKPFKISGFEWDYSGTVSSWEGGSLSNNLSLIFEKTKELNIINDGISGDILISSENKNLKETSPVVSAFYIRWKI